MHTFLSKAIAIFFVYFIGQFLPISAQAEVCRETDWDLTKEDGSRIAYAVANGHNYIGVLFLVSPVEAAGMMGRVKESGGYIQYHKSDLGLLSAVVPIARLDSLIRYKNVQATLVEQPNPRYSRYAGGVEIVNLDRRLKWYSEDRGKLDDQLNSKINSIRNTLHEPLSDPYDIRRDLNALEVLESGAPLDGRGIVIAQVENLPDVLLPELETALNENGSAVPKFLDVRGWSEDTYNPITGALSSSSDNWIELERVIDLGTEEQSTWPSAVHWESDSVRRGVFRFSRARIPEFLFETLSIDDDASDDILLSVVADIERGLIFFDKNADGNFDGSEQFGTYAQTHEFGEWGIDDPNTPIRESIGFAFELNDTSLGIHFGRGGHATMVAGAMAANKEVHGRINGVAPGAQLIVFDQGGTATNFARALVAAYEDERVDIIQIQGNTGITGNHDKKDGCSLLAQLVDRLHARYSKPAFLTASNLPGLSTAADLGSSENVISVGAYQSGSSVRKNRLLILPKEDNLHWNGSEGPNGRGEPNPDLLAPANPISLEVGFAITARPGLLGAVHLPPGYGIAAGTSTAAPVATGAAALLLDAANREDVCWNSSSLYMALYHGARFIHEIDAYRQGRGLMDVRSAWDIMKNNGCSYRPALRVSAPVLTEYTELGHLPGFGGGLFVSEGIHLGESYSWDVDLKIDPTVVESKLSIDILGNANNTFSLPLEVQISPNGKAKFELQGKPSVYGAHSALIVFKDHSDNRVIGQMLATIIAPREISELGSAETHSFELSPPYRENYYFRLNRNAELLEFSFRFPVARRWLEAIVNGPGLKYGQRSYRVWSDGNGEAFISIPNPEVGIWEISVIAGGELNDFDWRLFPSFELVPFNFEISTQVYQSSDPSITSGSSGNSEMVPANDRVLEVFETEVVQQTHDLSGRAFDEIDFETEATILVQFTAPQEIGLNTDYDLYLFKCGDDQCLPVTTSKAYFSNEQIQLFLPPDGEWKLVVISNNKGPNDFSHVESLTFRSIGWREGLIGKVSSDELSALVACSESSFSQCGRSQAYLVFSCGLNGDPDAPKTRYCGDRRELTRPRIIEIAVPKMLNETHETLE